MSESKTKSEMLAKEVAKEVVRATASDSNRKEETYSPTHLSVKESFGVFLADYKAANSK